MPKVTFERILNEIVKLFVRGGAPVGTNGKTRSFGIGSEYEISLLGDNIEAFAKALQCLHGSQPQIQQTLSLQELHDRVIALAREAVWGSGRVSLEDAKKFEHEIASLPLYHFRVVRRIYGVAVSPDSDPTRFGKFVVGVGTRLLGDDRERFLSLAQKPEDLNEVFIEFMVEARDTERAMELANSRFYSFEQIFRVFIGKRTKRIEVGILNYIGPQLRDCFIVAVDGPASYNSSWDGALGGVPLNHPCFSKPMEPISKLFDLISDKNTELERHILRCAEWTGQAIGDQNGASAFVKGVIALEVLFSAIEKGVITPSIMSQIAESCAFLIGGPDWLPWKVEKEVKRLYGVRSAVVHSGKDSVEEEDLSSLLRICREVVAVLLSNEDFAKITTMPQLADYFRRRKYSKTS